MASHSAGISSDGDNKERSADAFVFTRGDKEALKSFKTTGELTRERARLVDVRFHDLRSEYASRLVEKGVPLSQVRDLIRPLLNRGYGTIRPAGVSDIEGSGRKAG